LALQAAYTPTEDGLYAQFDTSEGEFTCKLRYDQAPMTVANFVGLAEGSLTWFDFAEKKISNEPFYDGLTFHRIVSDSFIQGGSPNGKGNDGPGYQIPNEISTDLTHDEDGVIAMANAGVNTASSQFYVTTTSFRSLDYAYSVFGNVVNGLPVVAEISNGELDPDYQAGDKPINPVVINKVTIIRVGSEAEAFDPSQYPLPKVTSLPHRFYKDGEDLKLEVIPYTWSNFTITESNDLATWDYISPDDIEVDEDTGARSILLDDTYLDDKSHFFATNSIRGYDLYQWAGKDLTLNYDGDEDNNEGFPTQLLRTGENGALTRDPDSENSQSMNYRLYKLSDSRYQFRIYLYSYYYGQPILTVNSPLFLTFDEGSDTEGSFFQTDLLNKNYQGFIANPISAGLFGRFTLTDSPAED